MTKIEINRRELCGRGGMMLALMGGVLSRTGEAPAADDDDAWSLWRSWNDRRLAQTPLALVAAAALAASPHNTQPWLFHVAPDRIEVFADLARNLGAMDYFLREMHLGIGCAIENAILAGPPNGFDVDVEAASGSLLKLSARRGRERVATLHLSARPPRAPEALYRAIPKRHTDRYAYRRDRPLPKDWTDFAAHSGVSDDVRLFLFQDGPKRAEFDSTVVAATQAIIADAAMSIDGARWVRTSQADVATHRDGLALANAGLSDFVLFVSGFIPVSRSIADQAWLSQTRETHLPSAPLVGLIAVRDRYDIGMTVDAGRTWQRLHLSATVENIAMQPLNQPIEMIDEERRMHRDDGWSRRIQALTGQQWDATFAFRAGYAERPSPPSARRPLREILLS